MCLFCSFRSSFQNSACSFQKQQNCRYSNFPYFSGFLRCNRQKSLKYQAFRQIQSRPKPPSKITKQPLTYKTRNQVVAQAARGFESHPIRQQEPVIKPITGSFLFSETGNSVLLHFFGEKIIHSPQRRSSLHRLVKSSRQTASAAPCQGTAQQFVSLLCVETADAHHGKCANENLPKSEYGSLLRGCRKQENRRLMIQPTIIFR